MIRLTALAATLILASTAAFAATPVTKEELPALVQEVLMNDPEIIMKAMEKLQAQKERESQEKMAKAVEENAPAILKNPAIPSYGASASKADVTLVEFFDYHCGYCKHFLPELTKVVDADKKVRVLFVDYPILSEDSETAAKAAIAVNRLDKSKYFEFHTALMKESGKFDEARLVEIAEKVGIDGDKLKKEMAKPEVRAMVEKNRDTARKIGIRGTPAIIIGKELIPGAMSADDLKKVIANTRAGKNPSEGLR